MNKLKIAFWLVVALIVPQLCLCVTTPASHAQDDIRRELALSVAKLCVNEAGFSSAAPADCALLWQVTRARARTSEGRLAWLRAHSSCVLTDRPMNEDELQGNCRFTRHLSDSDVEPEGWPAEVDWSHFVRRWRQMRTFTYNLVTGRVRMEPCPATPVPFTWGSDQDRAHALRRGLVPLDCRDPRSNEPTLNTAYALADES